MLQLHFYSGVVNVLFGEFVLVEVPDQDLIIAGVHGDGVIRSSDVPK